MGADAWISVLTFEELAVVEACLLAAADGPFFPDWEFQTLFGLERQEVRRYAESWPEGDEDVLLAVAGSLNNLTGYPHQRDDVWTDWIPVSRERVRDLLWKIREASGANDESRRVIRQRFEQLLELPTIDLARRTKEVATLLEAAARYGVEPPRFFTNPPSSPPTSKP